MGEEAGCLGLGRNGRGFKETQGCVSTPADPQDALHCLHVSRDEACLTVSFSRPVLVSPTALLENIVDCGLYAVGADRILSLSPVPGGLWNGDLAAHG